MCVEAVSTAKPGAAPVDRLTISEIDENSRERAALGFFFCRFWGRLQAGSLMALGFSHSILGFRQHSNGRGVDER